MPEGAYSAGTIFLQVVPSYRGLQESIRRKVGDVDKALNEDMEANAAKTGERVGKVLGENIAKAAEPAAKKATEKYEGAFRTSMKRAAAAAQRELDTINFDTASDRTLGQLETIKKRVRDLGKTEITPDFDGAKVLAEIAAIDKALADVKKNRKINEVFDLGAAEKSLKGFTQAVENEMARIRIPDKVLKQVDRDMGAFERTVKKHVKDAFTAIGDTANPQLKKLRAEMDKILKSEFNIDIDANSVVSEVAKIKLALNSLKANQKIDISTRGDAAAAVESFNRISAALDDIEPKVEKVDRQMSKFARDFQKHIRTAIADLGDAPEFRDLQERLGHLKDIDLDVEVDSGSALRELASIAAAAKAVGAISPDIRIQTNAASAAASMGAAGAAGGAASNLGGLSGKADDAANSFRAFNGVLFAAITIGPALIPIVAALAGGLAALGVAAMGAGAGLGVMILGFSGIGDAVSAMGDVTKNAEKDALQASSTIRNALQAVADARRSLTRATQDAATADADAARAVVRAQQDAKQANQDAARAIVDAQRSAAAANEDAARRVRQAQEAAARAVEDALGRQQDAEEALADAQRDAAEAVENLRDARRAAAQDLEDIRDQQRQNALDERQAVIDLFNATVAFNAAQQDPGSTNLEREQAAINLGNARERLHEIREEETRLAQERKKGVKGSDEVKSAQDAVTQALEAQQDAQEALGEASAAVDQARIDGARDVNAALRDQRRIALDGARSIKEAERSAARTRIDGIQAVADALRNQHRTEVDGRQSVADAQRNLRRAQQDYQDALKQTGEIGSTSLSNLHDAMSKLSPAGRRFARYLYSLRGLFYDIRDAAQEGMLPGVQNAMQMIIGRYGRPFRRFVGEMARVLGHLFELFGRRLTKGGFEQFFGMLDRLGPRFLRQAGRGLINWLETFANLATATAPFARRLSDGLLALSRAALRWSKSEEGTRAWSKFMGYAFRVGPLVIRFFSALWRAFINLAHALAPLGGLILTGLTLLLEWVASLDPDVLGLFAMAILGIVFAFQLAAIAIAGWFIIMAPIGSVIGGVALVVGLLVAALVILYTKSKTARKIINAVFSAIGHVAKWLFDNILKPYFRYAIWIWGKIGRFFKWIWDQILHPVFSAIGRVVKWLWEKIFDPYLTAVGKVWGFIFKTMKWVWLNVMWPIFKVIGKIVWELWKLQFKPALWAIKQAWHGLSVGLKWVWTHVLKPLFDGFMNIIGDDLVQAFKDGIEAIRRNWDKIKEIAKIPVRFVIQTVMNDGIIAGFNKLAGWTGMDKISPIKLPKGFARGGVYPGYSPGRDTGFIGVGGGEAIMRPEWTRVVGPSEVERMNAAARMGGIAGVKKYLGGFARGGVVDWKKRFWPVPGHDVSTYPGHDGIDINRGSGSTDLGDPIRAAAAGKISYVGTAHGYGNAIFEHGPYGTVVYGHTSRRHVKAGQFVNAGQLIGNVGNTGNSTAPHLHFGFPGGTPEMARRFLQGAMVNGGGGIIGALGNALSGLAGWVKDLVSAPVDWFKDRVGDGFDKIKTLAGGGKLGEALQRIPMMAIHGIADWIKTHLSLDENGTLPGADALAFGKGAEGIWRSLLSTGFYTAKQAAGVMGNMQIESGLNPWIVQGGGSRRLPTGVGSGWGLVQWTPGTKILPYLDGDGSIASQISALTQQLRGIGPLAEKSAGQKIRAAGTPEAAAYAFGKYFERPADLSSTIDARRGYARQFFNRFKGGLLKGMFADGGVVPEDGAGGAGPDVPDNGSMMMYDRGGYLPPGITTVLNMTGAKEPVFTDEQWSTMGRGGGPGGWTYAPTFLASDLTAEDVAGDLLFTVNRMHRGGVYTGAR